MISIVIPLRNECDRVEALLAAAVDQLQDDEELEFIFIDGASVDDTKERIQELQKNDRFAQHFIEGRKTIRVLDNPRHFVSGALNLAIAEAKGEIIVRWDAHTEYASDYIEQCVRTLEGTNAWNVGGPARTKADGYLQRAVAAAYHSAFSVGGASFHDIDYEGYVDTVTYGCWRKKTLIDLGGFDEELVRNQDDELNLRIVREGGTIYQSPSIKSWYHPRSTLSALFKQYLQYGYWKVRVIRKHRIPASIRHLVPVSFVTGLVLGPLLGYLFPVLFAMYLIAVAAYFGLLSVFSVATSRKNGWDLLLVMPVVFLTYHISYGIGFLGGLIDSIFCRKGSAAHSVFTGLSR
ncbi:MAG: glycosyltransferase family 2 protein [Bacteroidota bacterium]